MEYILLLACSSQNGARIFRQGYFVDICKLCSKLLVIGDKTAVGAMLSKYLFSEYQQANCIVSEHFPCKGHSLSLTFNLAESSRMMLTIRLIGDCVSGLIVLVCIFPFMAWLITLNEIISINNLMYSNSN